MLAAVAPSPPPPAFAPKSEPGFCSESDLLRQRYALLQAEESSIAAATQCVQQWTVEERQQLKAIDEELPLAGVRRCCSAWWGGVGGGAQTQLGGPCCSDM